MGLIVFARAPLILVVLRGVKQTVVCALATVHVASQLVLLVAFHRAVVPVQAGETCLLRSDHLPSLVRRLRDDGRALVAVMLARAVRA